MTPTRTASVDRFADLKTLYAEAVATPEFQAVFGDPMPRSIIEPGDEPGEHDMPEPLAAQAECGGIVAAIFDLFTGTRLEPFAPEIAWGIVNSFHFVAGKIERREDAMAQELGDLARRPDLSEVYSNELEEKQLLCRSLAEQRDAIECMRDYAAEMYRALSGWPWSPAKGSRTSTVSIASQIAVQDFLRERQLVARERNLPQGPIVIFSGPAQWENWQPIWDRLDQIKARLPHMTLVTTGQRKGGDAIAAAWAARPGNCVTLVAYGLYGVGKKVAFNRNRIFMFICVDGVGQGRRAQRHQGSGGGGADQGLERHGAGGLAVPSDEENLLDDAFVRLKFDETPLDQVHARG